MTHHSDRSSFDTQPSCAVARQKHPRTRCAAALEGLDDAALGGLRRRLDADADAAIAYLLDRADAWLGPSAGSEAGPVQ